MKKVKSLYPALMVVVMYVAIMVLKEFKILNGYYIQVLMFAGINVMFPGSVCRTGTVFSASVCQVLSLPSSYHRCADGSSFPIRCIKPGVR